MKQFFKILALAALALPFSGCDVEYSDINILPDPVFEQNGLYTVNTISIYDDYETVINVSRTAGLSKELELDIVVDEVLLAEYNELYNTDYKLLETQFYDIPQTAHLSSTVKSVDISVRVRPKALIAAKGMAAANNMLLPVRISSTSVPVEDGGAMMQALLRLSIVDPVVQVELPEQMPHLEFIPTIPLPQEITLNATANFNTLEVAKIGYKVNQSKVDTYNGEHGTSYRLLPEQYYEIGEDSFDAETLEIESRIEFDCAAIGGEETYLLPLEMNSDDYSVVQREPVYVVIQMSELKIWVTNGADLAKTSGKGKIRVQMNSPMTVGQPVGFVFEPEKVGPYNTEHGTSFRTLDAAEVTVTPTEIPAGSQYGELSFELDLSELEYDGADKYMVPLTIESSGLVDGTVVTGPSTFYIEVNKTLKGTYDKEIWGEEKTNRVLKPAVFIAGQDGYAESRNAKKQKYIINYNQVWSGGLIYFNISDETVAGYPNRRILVDFSDRPNERADGYDGIVDSGSYLDTETGDIYFNLRVMDGAYAATGGFGIEVVLSNRADL